MTDRDLMQQALNALDSAIGNINPERGFAEEAETEIAYAITALRERLARQEPNSSAGTQVSKVWWDGERLMAESIPLEQMYKPAQQEQDCGCPDQTHCDGRCCKPARQEREQEPVAWVWPTDREISPEDAFSWVETAYHTLPLYTTPQREWQGLTDEEAMQIIDTTRHGSNSGFGFMRVVRAVEQALKGRNT